MARQKVILIIIILTVTSCLNKSKFDLHMERGLDVLDNTIEVNQEINEIFIKKIGVILDRNKDTRVLIMEVENDSLIKMPEIKIVALKEILGKFHNKEVWKFKPNFKIFKKNQYLFHEIKTDINTRIDTLYLSLNNSNDSLVINNLYLDNE